VPRFRVWIAVLALALASPARAGDGDGWQVRRQGSAAVESAAVTSLLERPHERGLTLRVVSTLGPEGARRVLRKLAVHGESRSAARRFQAFCAQAELLLALGDAGAAAAAFARALEVRPDSVAAAEGRARALVKAGADATSAGKHTEAAAAAAPNEPHATNRAGDDLDAPGEYAAALERHASRTSSPRLKATFLAAAAAKREAALQWSEAFDAWMGVLALEGVRGAGQLARPAESPPGVHRFTTSGLMAALERTGSRSRRLTELAGELRARTARTPRDALAWRTLSRVEHALGDLPRALRSAESALAAAPGDLAAAERVARLARLLGVGPTASSASRRLSASRPFDVDLAVGELEAVANEARGQLTADAEGAFRSALRRFATDPRSLERLADAATGWGRDDWALLAWEAAVAANPRSERALVGLGEAHFQRGRRELAQKTWARLLTAIEPRARAHETLAGIFIDHDMVSEAEASARKALRLDERLSEPYRILARAAEDKRLLAPAIEAWQALLDRAEGPERAFERREARSRLLGLYAKEGARRMLAEAERRRRLFADGGLDREEALFLADIEQQVRQLDRRGGAADRAASTLQMAMKAWPDDHDVATRLLAMLRRSGQWGAATELLERLLITAPQRSAWALAQLADLWVERGRLRDAESAAERATGISPTDPTAWIRLGQIQERRGLLELTTDVHAGEVALRRALASFDRAQELDGTGRATAASAKLLLAEGRLDEARRLLLDRAARAQHPGTAADLAALARVPSLLLGDLEGLDAVVATTLSGAADGTGREPSPQIDQHHRLLLADLVPGLYRERENPTSAAALGRVAQLGLRPLVEPLAPGARARQPDLQLLGMLGRREAVPVIVGAIARELGAITAARSPDEGPVAKRKRAADAAALDMTAAMVALGRLGDDRGGPVLCQGAMIEGRRATRLAALWALGRLGQGTGASEGESGEPPPTPWRATAEEILRRAVGEQQAEAAALAALSLGRLGVSASIAELVRQFEDVRRPVVARQGAALGLGFVETPGGAGAATQALVRGLEDGDQEVAVAAAAALGHVGGPSAAQGLWHAVLAAPAGVAGAALEALALMGRPLPDEALVVGREIDVDAVIRGLLARVRVEPHLAISAERPLGAALEHLGSFAGALAAVVGHGGAGEARALDRLWTWLDGPGEVAALITLLGPELERVHPLVRDPDPAKAAAALAIVARVAPTRLTAQDLRHVMQLAPGASGTTPDFALDCALDFERWAAALTHAAVRLRQVGGDVEPLKVLAVAQTHTSSRARRWVASRVLGALASDTAPR
jgi:hypothetical protein